jgi:hypothetical protein
VVCILYLGKEISLGKLIPLSSHISLWGTTLPESSTEIDTPSFANKQFFKLVDQHQGTQRFLCGNMKRNESLCSKFRQFIIVPSPSKHTEMTQEDLDWLNADLSRLGEYEPYDWGSQGPPDAKPVQFDDRQGWVVED